MTEKTVARNFSRYARTYDLYSDIQRKTGRELIRWSGRKHCDAILEIGCGTGNYTRLLREKFPEAAINAVDISGAMIEVAGAKLRDKNIEFVVADGETMKPGGEFDLITSNACFQWFDDLERAMLRYSRLLRQDGIILFSAFGPSTFRELRAALSSALPGGSIAAAGFLSAERTGQILRKNFDGVRIRETAYEETFNDLRGLLNKIKRTGVRGSGLGEKRALGRKTMAEIELAYKSLFHRITATYQVFFCRGRAR